MIAGAQRYSRSLGFVAGLGDGDTITHPNNVESILGINASGKLKSQGGQGLTIDLAPSTFLGAILGATLGVMLKSEQEKDGGIVGGVSGALVGGLLGAMAATGLRAAGHFGV